MQRVDGLDLRVGQALVGILTFRAAQGLRLERGFAADGILDHEIGDALGFRAAQHRFQPQGKDEVFVEVAEPFFELRFVGDRLWHRPQLLDRLAMLTTEAFMATREELISRQQQELMELSTPVVKLWDGILALPVIGTLDSARTQVVMENLLQTVVATNSKFAIIDITGVPTVDTLVAQHLLKTITAARLMGAECIISGIRPEIAQTIVHLGIDLSNINTKASLAHALKTAFAMTKYEVRKQTVEKSK